MSDKLDIEAIEARLNAATPGEWYREILPDGDSDSGSNGSDYETDEVLCENERIARAECGPDATLIAHAPEDLRALLAEVRRLTTRLAFLEDVPTDGGWCTEHPRRVQADTAEMAGRDSNEGGDGCLACEVRRLTDANQRLTDLVRYQRGPLHDEGLITDAEYADLAGLTGSPARLEGYDALRGELERTKRALNVATGERDAYRRAKEENDERFMLERDAARADLQSARVEGARVMRERVAADLGQRANNLRKSARVARKSGGEDNASEWFGVAKVLSSIAKILPDPVVVVESAPGPALGCTTCPNFVAMGGNAGGWRCRAVDNSVVVGLWIDEATGATNGYMPDGSAGEVPSDARTCPAFGKPAAVVGSGS